MTYYYDNKRHIVCIPYSIENLHIMAIRLGIRRCWFHRNHYDRPIYYTYFDLDALGAKLVSTREIVLIIKHKKQTYDKK